MRALVALSSLVLAACASVDAVDATRSTAADEQALLALHEAVLRAHRERNVDALLATHADDFTLMNRGELSAPTKAKMREVLGPYLAATTFEFYRDAVKPRVKVSKDGTLGWVIAQVEARGQSTNSRGASRPLEFTVAWIELYERRDGAWVSIGNGSSFKNE
jgi:ketosteroid isomerase-like protein